MVKPKSRRANTGLANDGAKIDGDKPQPQDFASIVPFVPKAAQALASAAAPPREACDGASDSDKKAITSTCDNNKENDPTGDASKVVDHLNDVPDAAEKACSDEDAVSAAVDDSGNYGDAEPDSSHSDPDSDSDNGHEDKLNAKATTDSPAEQPEKKIRGRPSACVFVASLSSLHSDDQLNKSVSEHFAQWGTIALVKVLRDTNNRPYAFVQYSSNDEASAALEAAQHTTLNDRLIRVEPARVNRTLYVTPLKSSLANDEAINAALSEFGEVEQLVATKVPLGAYQAPANWYAKFAYRDDAIRAFASLRVGSDWSVEWSQNLDTPGRDGTAAIDKLSIFIGQLDHTVTEEKLRERFGTHGAIADCNLIIRPPDPTKVKENGEQRNGSFAFIKFETEEAAAEAVEQENHTVFMDKTMHVQYRELNHHAHSAAYKSSSEFKLNLAPPPISMPKYSGYYGDTFMDLHRINARHSNMPVTPLPYNRRMMPQAAMGYGRPRGGYFSPAGEASMQAQRGSSPFSSPSPSNSTSPASNRQSPLSNASSAPSDRSYAWGNKRGGYGLDSRQHGFASSPRGGFGGNQQQQFRGGKPPGKFAGGPPSGDGPKYLHPNLSSRTSYRPRGAAGEGNGRSYGAIGPQPFAANKSDGPGQAPPAGQAAYPKGPMGGLPPQQYGNSRGGFGQGRGGRAQMAVNGRRK